MKQDRSKNKYVLLMILMVFIMSGCGSVKIRSSDFMYNNNPINKIELFAVAKVVYPGIGSHPSALGLAESKTLLEKILPQTKEALSRKGYEVITCEPVGIGHYDPLRKATRYYEDYEKSQEIKLTNGRGSDPVYEYEMLTENLELKSALKSVFEDIQTAINEKRVDTFTPSTDDMQVIRIHSKADTVCFNRIFGVKYTTARKSGSAGLAVVAGLLGAHVQQLKDMIESYLVFVDTSSGEVMWQHGIFKSGDPVNPDIDYIDKVLASFPIKGQQMDKKFKK